MNIEYYLYYKEQLKNFDNNYFKTDISMSDTSDDETYSNFIYTDKPIINKSYYSTYFNDDKKELLRCNNQLLIDVLGSKNNSFDNHSEEQDDNSFVNKQK